MAKERILVVEDEEDILALVHYNLVKEGYEAVSVTSGEEGIDAARDRSPALVILDLMLPGIDGLEVCRRLKQDEETRPIPILMLTARGEESDIVRGLEMGADDYVTKPFSPRVLISRVRAVLRRVSDPPSGGESDVLRFEDLVIHPGRNEVLVQGKSVDLTYTEFQVLRYLASRPGWVFTRDQIVGAVRGEGYAVTDRAVDVQIVGLRKKLGPRGSCIETVRGVGYRFRG